jgi:hypothetical protein
VSAYRTVRIFCDHRDPPAEGASAGRARYTEFDASPDLGFVSQIGVMRRAAAKAGWTYIRDPRVRALDEDLCPLHKPQEATDG